MTNLALLQFMSPIELYASNQKIIGFFLVLQSWGMVPKLGLLGLGPLGLGPFSTLSLELSGS